MMENKSSSVPQWTQSPEDMIKQLQDYLRKYKNDNKLVILEAVEKPATKPGDNWTSVLMRTKFIGTCGDGSPYIKSFIIKKIAQDKKLLPFLNPSALFRSEAHVYLKVLPILGSFGPQCVYADKNTIIMEDLTEMGYATCEKRNFLDLNHTIFGLKKLATFHASALSLKINNPLQFNTLCMPLEEILHEEKSNMISYKSFLEECMKSILRYLDLIEPQTQELQTIKSHIATSLDKICDSMLYRLYTAKKKYDTICHGDLWINNLLFLHDKDGRIIDLKIIDYQLTKHTSVSSDILYFIYANVQSSLIERSFESLIKIYHNEFLNELRKSCVDEKVIKEFGMEWLEKELQTSAYHGLIIASMSVNMLYMDEEDIKKFEASDFDIDMQVDINSIKTQLKLDRIKCLLPHYYRRLHLGIINDDIEPISIKE